MVRVYRTGVFIYPFGGIDMALLDVEKMYTREEAARKLGMAIATFDRLRYAGKIEEIHVSPHKIRFTDEALDQYLAAQIKPSAVSSSDGGSVHQPTE